MLTGETFYLKVLKQKKQKTKTKTLRPSSSGLSSTSVVVGKPALGERIHGFALLPPVLGPRLCRLLALGEGQVGGDAVPDAVAQHAVVEVLRAGQLSSAKGEQRSKLLHSPIAKQAVPFLNKESFLPLTHLSIFLQSTLHRMTTGGAPGQVAGGRAAADRQGEVNTQHSPSAKSEIASEG